ncbi:MAG: beta-1-3, beta-1-6-glucan biosynthesis protein [Alphaproteobacteria bacterium]|nr:beta-1-3, beta-1-6-glucan biosynthesis protein [Alphaproteobacteria bacterium]
MSFFARISFVVAVTVASALTPAFAQTADTKPADKPAAEKSADPAKDAQRQVDEFAEATRLVNGPAGNPECVWLGRRVVGLMWRDDMDTAFRHLDLYDRFGCPGPHIQSSFRCVVRQGNNIDPKSPQSLNARVHSCWLNPTAASQATAAAPAGAAPTAAAPAGAAAATPAGATPPPPAAQISGPSQATAGTPNKEAR